MPTANELSMEVWDAMNALPKPVTNDQALNAAMPLLSGQMATQFTNWWTRNGDTIVVKLNGR